MWIEQLTNGNFKYIERYKDPYTEKLKKVSVTLTSKSRTAQKEALSMLDEKISIKLNNLSLSDVSITFEALIMEWSQIYKQQVRENTYLTTLNLINSVRLAIGNETLVNKIDSILINNILEDFLYGKRNLSNKYVSIIKSKLKIIFRYAVKKGYIANNPIDKVEIQYKRDQSPSKIKDKFLEKEEYEKIIAFSVDHNKRYGLLFQWLYLTGMRVGEALALTKNDVVINLSENIFSVNINGTMQYRGRKVTDQIKSEETKTVAGIREIDLPKKAVNVYNELLKMNADSDSTFIFTTSKGTTMQITAVNTYLRWLKDKINLDNPLSTHIFRHTHISKLAEIGTPLFAIQDKVGHENSRITETIYLHVTKGVKDK